MSTRQASSKPKHPAGETRALVKRYAKQGLSPRDIGKLLDISTQAVYQHLHALRAAGELPPEEVAS